jgi:hypothetical protein
MAIHFASRTKLVSRGGRPLFGPWPSLGGRTHVAMASRESSLPPASRAGAWGRIAVPGLKAGPTDLALPWAAGLDQIQHTRRGKLRAALALLGGLFGQREVISHHPEMGKRTTALLVAPTFSHTIAIPQAVSTRPHSGLPGSSDCDHAGQFLRKTPDKFFRSSACRFTFHRE